MKERRTKKIRNDFSISGTFYLILFCYAATKAALAAKEDASSSANLDSETMEIDSSSTPSPDLRKNFYLPADFLFASPDLSILSNNTKKNETAPPVEKVDRPEITEKFVRACMEEIDKGYILTENDALTYCTSGSPVVDFFFHVMEQTTPENTVSLLEKSWANSPDDTLRLIANLRDVRGGKSIRYQSMICFYWLYVNHPLTLYNNLEHIPEVGYWKDLLHIMMTILFDGHVGQHLKFDDCPDETYNRKPFKEKKKECHERGRIYSDMVIKSLGVDSRVKIPFDSKKRKELNLQYGKQKFVNDPKYRLFHLKIAQLFADQLKKDIKYLEANETSNIGLCAKWSPSESRHFDKFSLINTSISAKLLDENHQILKDYKNFTDGLQDEQSLERYQSAFAYLARKEYDKKYIRPLRDACKIPELYMHPDKWGELDYKRVPSKCMMKNKKSFMRHDGERFGIFINESKKVAGATIKPVELVQKILEEDSEEDREEDNELCKQIYEKQWISLVESLTGKGGLFESALSICDVSGSMFGMPLNAALGLTLLTSQLSKPPWSSVCMTFSNKPHFHNISQDSLYDKLISMLQMDWDMNTNVDAAFELILKTAVEHKLKSEDLPKILFLFTDMEFDECVRSDKTNFEHIKQRFVEEGYKLPTVVFWNLRSSGRHSTPIKSTESGTILISGYSARLLSFIMSCRDISEVTPTRFVDETLKHYEHFKVYD